jgi:hypothetical protein
VAGPSENGKECSGSAKAEEILDYLRDY